MDKVSQEDPLRIRSVEQFMELCTEWNAHLNLCLEKSGADGSRSTLAARP